MPYVFYPPNCSAHPCRVQSLDGLRAVSILMVITSHFALAYGRVARPNSPSAQIVGLLNLGALGVAVFFVISGYLITHLLLQEDARSGTINLPRFYFRRTIRIFPPLYVFLGILSVGDALGLVHVTFRNIWPAAAYISDYLNTHSWVAQHTWSLAVEEQFYLLWPLCMRYGGLRSCKFFCWAVICVSPVARYLATAGDSPSLRFFRFDEVADSLATGCLLALFVSQDRRIFDKLLTWRLEPFLIVCVVTLSVWPCHPSICPARLFSTVGVSAINLGIGLLLIYTIYRIDGWLAWILNTRAFVTVGVLSYSLYIWQQCFTNPDYVANGWTTGVNLVFIGFAAWLSYHLIERPSLRLRTRWEKRLFPGEVVESFRAKPLAAQMSRRY